MPDIPARIRNFAPVAGGLCAIAALVCAMGSVSANPIYKWTDSDGSVHYGDLPAADVQAERVDIESKPTDNERVASLVQARRAAQTEAQRASTEAAAAEDLTPEQLRAEQEVRAQKCTQYKERLQQFLQSRRLYREDENGERVYLDEQQTLAARNNVQKQVEEYCTN